MHKFSIAEMEYLQFDEIFITGCTGNCQTTSVASEENFVKMTTFSFQRCKFDR